MQSKLTLSVIFSFKNEEQVIPELLNRLRSVLNEECPGAYELIFVNDRSTDRSEEILMDEARKHHDIKIITTARNAGVSPCVLLGMEYSSGEAVIYMDSDLQDPPEIIPELLKKRREGYDVVHTIRLSRTGESKIKLLITQTGYRIIKWVSSIDLLVNAGDFKLLSRKAVNEVNKLKEKKPYMRGLATWVGFNQTQIYYHREARGEGDTKFPIFSLSVINNFLDSALISFSDVPLKIFMLVGFIISLLAFMYLPYIGIKKLFGFTIAENYLFIAAFFFLCGMILLGIGILGLYTCSIFFESKKRPNYIIDRKFGFNPTDYLNNNQQTQNNLGNLITENEIFNIYFNQVQDNNQKVSDYLIVEPKLIKKDSLVTGVAILPIYKDKFGLLRVKRYAINADSWEIPRGFIKVEESIKQSAIRELEEETGILCQENQ